MKKKYLSIFISLLILILGVGATAYYIYQSNSNQNEITKDNIAGKLEQLENDINKTNEELNAKLEEIQNLSIQEQTDSSTTTQTSEDEIVVTDTLEAEEEYLAQLENNLEEYYTLYQEAEDLVYELNQLINEYNQALVATEDFYSEVNSQVQQTIDEAQLYKTQLEEQLNNAKSSLNDIQSQYDSMNNILSQREELLKAKKSGDLNERMKAYKDYFSNLENELSNLRNYQNQFSEQFVQQYLNQMPDYLASNNLENILQKFNTDFSLKSFTPTKPNIPQTPTRR